MVCQYTAPRTDAERTPEGGINVINGHNKTAGEDKICTGCVFSSHKMVSSYLWQGLLFCLQPSFNGTRFVRLYFHIVCHIELNYNEDVPSVKSMCELR